MTSKEPTASTMASIERRLSKVLTPSGLRRQPTTHYDEAAAQAAKLAEEAHRSIMGLAGAAVETMSPALQKVLWTVFCDIATVSWGNSKALGELDKALAELRSRFKTEFGSER